MKLSIIIPAYNEAGVISSVIEHVARADTGPFEKEIIVVNDGATDGTGDALSAISGIPSLKIITHRTNAGKTAAIRSALAAASGDVVMIQDADREYSPDDYPALLAPFRDPVVRVVFGSRFLGGRRPKDMRLSFLLANRLFVLLVNLLYRAGITDEGTAYKLFRSDVIHSLDLRSPGFGFEPEATTQVLRRGIKIVEVPISYAARGRDEGKKPRVRDGIQTLWTIVRNRFERRHT